MDLTENQISFYRGHGYLVIDELIDRATVEKLNRVVGTLTKSSGLVSANNEMFDLEASHSSKNPRPRRIKDPHTLHPVFRDMASDLRITNVIAGLLGQNFRIQLNKVNIKWPIDGSPVEWHQDWGYYPLTNDDALAVGIMLDDFVPENGPLLVIAGSHDGPVHDHHQNGCFVGAIDPGESNLPFGDAVALTGAAGSVSFHHTRLVHGSGLNHTSSPRRLLLTEYAAADAWPLVGVADFEEFNGRVVRGAPTLEPRLESVPVRLPYPRAMPQGTIFEHQQLLKQTYFQRADA